MIKPLTSALVLFYALSAKAEVSSHINLQDKLTPMLCWQQISKSQPDAVLIDFTGESRELRISLTTLPKNNISLAVYFKNNFKGAVELFSLLFIGNTSAPIFVINKDVLAAKDTTSCQLLNVNLHNINASGISRFSLSIVKRSDFDAKSIFFLDTMTVLINEI